MVLSFPAGFDYRPRSPATTECLPAHPDAVPWGTSAWPVTSRAFITLRRAADERDELTAFQSVELHVVPASLGRIAGYRFRSGQSAGALAILQPE